MASRTALAHGSIQGVDHFSGGLLHPLIEPTHLLALVALGLLIGQRGIARAEGVLAGFAAGLVLGLVAAAFGRTFDADLALLAVAALTGALVALSFALPAAGCAVLGAAIGGAVGMGSNPDAFTGSALLAALSGAGLGAGLFLLSVAAVVNALRRPWLTILVRVVGSWACAASVLVLALWLSGRPLEASAGVAPPGAPAPLDTTR
jgi:hydrogenase/urease accessory protein HupE